MSDTLKTEMLKYKDGLRTDDIHTIEKVYREHVAERQRIVELVDYTLSEGSEILAKVISKLIIFIHFW